MSMPLLRSFGGLNNANSKSTSVQKAAGIIRIVHRHCQLLLSVDLKRERKMGWKLLCGWRRTVRDSLTKLANGFSGHTGEDKRQAQVARTLRILYPSFTSQVDTSIVTQSVRAVSETTSSVGKMLNSLLLSAWNLLLI
jgi:hypothetical protein